MIPVQYKITESIKTQYPDVVDYPPPTHLRTMKKSDGHSFFHEEELDTWLRNIANNKVSKDENPVQAIKDFISSYQDQSPKVNYSNQLIYITHISILKIIIDE